MLHIRSSDIEGNADVKLVRHWLALDQTKLADVVAVVWGVDEVGVVQFPRLHQHVVHLWRIQPITHSQSVKSYSTRFDSSSLLCQFQGKWDWTIYQVCQWIHYTVQVRTRTDLSGLETVRRSVSVSGVFKVCLCASVFKHTSVCLPRWSVLPSPRCRPQTAGSASSCAAACWWTACGRASWPPCSVGSSACPGWGHSCSWGFWICGQRIDTFYIFAASFRH